VREQVQRCGPARPSDRLENYLFLTSWVEIKKSNLYGISTGAILGRFSNTAAVSVWWSTSRFGGMDRGRSNRGCSPSRDASSGPVPIPDWSLALIGNASGQTAGAERDLDPRGFR
jgi:hypothetical protein